MFAQHGYTPAGLYAFYQAQSALLASEFPGKTMSYGLIQDGFPRVNNAGDYEKSDGTSSGGLLPGTTEQTQTIIDNGQAAYGLQFAVQHNGLGPKNADNCLTNFNGPGCPNKWVLQEGKEGQVTGFQTSNEGKVANPVIRPNPGINGLRASFELDTNDVSLAELRLAVMKNGKAVSETWLYRWTP